MKLCTACNTTKPLDEMVKHSGRADGYSSRCRVCAADKERLRLMVHVVVRSPAQLMAAAASSRAKKQGVPFNLKASDIVIPERCPVFGTLLSRGVGRSTDQSPSLDKIVPALGYVAGNVVVVSQRANRLKNDATVDELNKLAAFYNQHS